MLFLPHRYTFLTYTIRGNNTPFLIAFLSTVFIYVLMMEFYEYHEALHSFLECTYTFGGFWMAGTFGGVRDFLYVLWCD